MQKIINELNKAYKYLNNELFGGNLPYAMINVVYNTKKPKAQEETIMGIFYPTIEWKKDNEKYLAISITSDAINSGSLMTLSALVHEMVHGYCKIMNIDDMDEKSKNKHTEDFKIYAEMAKLEVKRSKKVGWGVTYPTSELMDIFRNIGIDESVFEIDCDIEYTETEKKKSAKKKKFKHYCSSCNRTIETKDGLPLICGVCNSSMALIESPENSIKGE